jgi:UDP-glucose 4-epimerase
MNLDKAKISQNILVTGGAGYIGSNLVNRLCNTGRHVVVVDNLSSGSTNNLHKNALFMQGELADSNFLRGVFKESKIDLVYHFAAKKSVVDSTNNPEVFMEENVENTSILLSAMHEFNCTKLVFASTAAVYGNREVTKFGYSETDPLLPSSPYGLSKLIAEQRIMENVKCTNLQALSFRFFNVAMSEIFQDLNAHGDLLSVLTDCIKGGKVFPIFGHDYETPDGTCYRDFIHMSDLLNALEHSEAFLHSTLDRFSVLNLGSGHGVSLSSIAKLGLAILGERFFYEYSNRRDGDVAFSLSNISSSEKKLGWKPKIDSENIFREFFESF